jgi:hypothetical protein
MKKEKELTVDILTLNEPTINGRIYTEKTLENALNDINQKSGIYGCFGDDVTYGVVPVDKISHLVEKVWIEGSTLKAQIKILETPPGKILDQVLSHVEFKPVGFGKIDSETGIVSDYRLAYVTAHIKE